MNDSITIIGNVATDPEHKRTSAGVPITTFRIASGQRRYDRAADAWVETATNFYSVSAFRGLADHAFHSLRRGERVILTGKLRVRDWESGDKRGTDVEIEAEALGHDLLWGTTTFVKDARPAAVSSSTSDSTEAWSAPGAAADAPSGSAVAEAAWTAPGEDAGSRELAGAETPF
ncbi:single-stranded DNA-binding protein [Microbacterium flavescens]|uniref:single-stranded DNA-binding protein n=1 Tax=Microbacterium flavescens TaxID=69366 RepID=UPI001BDE8A46|nr:single-stranded DNA-binding protein [Microbacterium flavescens]